MSDLYVLDDFAGVRLTLEEYQADFRVRQWSIDGQESWKLERGQHFREPGFPSWEAFARGEWDEALRLIAEERDFLTEFSAQAKGKGIELYRVRVVEEPIDPYLQWELHLLRLRAECGELIRVVGPGLLAGHEVRGPLPELVTLGSGTLYRVLYSEEGELAGAVRFSDSQVVTRAADVARDLYQQGEDLESFFRREVARLAPPSGT
jgi:Family of unknown function (DUF6879)